MFDFLHALVLEYGLLGLFFSTLIGSTIFLPFSAEPILLIVLKLGLDPYAILFTATIGSVIGTLVNYTLGYYGAGFIRDHVNNQRAHETKKWVDRYGWMGLLALLVLPLPLPVDPVTILFGVARMNLLEFTATVFLGKLVKYSIVLELLAFLV